MAGAIAGGLAIGILEKLFEIYPGQPNLGSDSETWFAFVFALLFLLSPTARAVRRKDNRAVRYVFYRTVGQFEAAISPIMRCIQ